MYEKSQARKDFEQAVQKRNWGLAYRLFNGLNMFEMLRALNDMDAALRQTFWKERAGNVASGEQGRMQFAWDVVDQSKMPDALPAAGTLAKVDEEQNAQIEDAKDFLAPVPDRLANVKYSDLYARYPLGTPEQAKHAIGGRADASWIDNTCALRMSRVLNLSGFPVPGPGQSPLISRQKEVSGADRMWYALLRAELQAWIRTQFGPPSLEVSTLGKTAVDRTRFRRLRGIIGFTIHFRDATGHLDLWDGAHFTQEPAASEDYWAIATTVALWRVHDWWRTKPFQSDPPTP